MKILLTASYFGGSIETTIEEGDFFDTVERLSRETKYLYSPGRVGEFSLNEPRKHAWKIDGSWYARFVVRFFKKPIMATQKIWSLFFMYDDPTHRYEEIKEVIIALKVVGGATESNAQIAMDKAVLKI